MLLAYCCHDHRKFIQIKSSFAPFFFFLAPSLIIWILMFHFTLHNIIIGSHKFCVLCWNPRGSHGVDWEKKLNRKIFNFIFSVSQPAAVAVVNIIIICAQHEKGRKNNGKLLNNNKIGTTVNLRERKKKWKWKRTKLIQLQIFTLILINIKHEPYSLPTNRKF